MPSTIITPDEIEHPLYEGPLEFSQESLEKAVRSKGRRPPGPVITLGQPQWWNLAHLAREKGESLPAELSLLLRDADFYLLQLACSFRPERDSEVDWARFTAFLRPKTGQEKPIAFDLYPREISEETKSEVKVSVAPSLKFAVFEGASVEGSLGEIVTTIELRRLEPVITAYGVLESAPNWDFEKHELHPLRGSKFCYLIVKKPRSAEAVRLTLDITVDVTTSYGLLSGRITEKDHAHLSQVVCTD